MSEGGDAPLSPEEPSQVIVAWNGTPGEVPPFTIDELFQRQTADPGRSGAIAVACGDRAWTYAELGRAAGQVAGWLHGAGIRAGDRVALCLDRTPELFAAMLGVLMAGACYVPLDASDPAERQRYIAEQARLSTFIIGRPRTVADAARLLVLDQDWLGTAQPPAPPRAPVSPAMAAYAVFTSGSTGQPKGVAMTHRALINLLWWHNRTRPGSCQSRTAQVCTVSFDFAFHEIFSTLCFGGTLVVADEESRRNPFALVRFLSEQAIERLFLPVTSLTQLAEAADGAAEALALREVITTGERLRITPAMARLFRRTGARLHNHYGATEFQDATTHTLDGDPSNWPTTVPIGRPIDNVRVYVLDPARKPVPAGAEGELCIAGAGVADGYLNQPERTAERFVADPFGEGTLYRTGDLARLRPDGVVEHLGRMDDQVKIRGTRIEPGEIEALLARHPAVAEAVVLAHEVDGHARLAAHLVLRQGAQRDDIAASLHGHLASQLPSPMLPEAYVVVDAMPLTPSGKTDRRRLSPPAAFSRLLADPAVPPSTATELLLAEVWRDVLRLDNVGAQDNFFDVGGTSMYLVEVQRRLAERLARPVSVVDLFRYPTIRALARHLDEPQHAPRPRARRDHGERTERGDIAIIGMAGRFPGAGDLDGFWRNLRDGVESITPLSDADLEQTAPGLLGQPGYVKAAAILPGIELFDAGFFDVSAKEAATLDPQQRVFLECSWEAFENAGYRPGASQGPVGVFCGSSMSTYLVNNLHRHFGYPADAPFIEADMLQFQLKLGNDRNYLPTRVSYKLDLRGPSVAVQTACSTSLVAVHLACRSLRSGESAMALAGGVSIIVPQKGGYLYEEGMIRSPDGHCRAFDARAGGTLFGNGCGVVLLKAAGAAYADGDHVIAVIKGSAINNDGSDKVGFTAPSVARQAEVIADALADAGVGPQTIGYVEAHGTGTAIGDPIEIAALNEAFRSGGDAAAALRRCAVGSVKSNIGHLDEAAGIAGLIKTALALQHRTVPPSLHFERPNPAIDFAGGPFFVNAARTDWPAADAPRRAGVSSFGMGGTNCHVVMEEARQAEPPGAPAAAQPHLLTLSARSPQALRELAGRYAGYLAAEPGVRFADVCFTAATGRRVFEHRFAVVTRTADEARAELENFLGAGGQAAPVPPVRRRVAFVFGGQGAQYPGMAAELYHREPVFRAALDRCAELVTAAAGPPLLPVLFPGDGQQSLVDDTRYAQPALFAVEYALAELWRSWEVLPDVLIGHSLGGYVAACLAGVFSLEDALTLVCERGRLMQATPQAGRMLSVSAGEEWVAGLIAPYRGQVSIAAVNGAESTVISGAADVVGQLRTVLAERGIRARELSTSHAFHSPLMRPMLADFRRVAESVAYRTPRLPVVSEVTGHIAGAEIAEPGYWVDHVMSPVRFDAAVAAAVRRGVDVFLEVSPRPTLLQFVREQAGRADAVLVPSLRPGRDTDQLLRSAAALYLAGAPLDPAALYRPGTYRRVPLPGYPWQRQRYWIDPGPPPPAPARSRAPGRGLPLLGRPLELPGSEDIRFESRLGPAQLPWLREHRVFGSIVMPGVMYLELVFAAAPEVFGAADVVLQDLVIHQAMSFPGEDAERQVQVVLEPAASGGRMVQIFSRLSDAGAAAWTRHASGRVAPAASMPARPAERLADLRDRFTMQINDEEIYQGEREREIDLGPLFWATDQLWREGSACLSRISLPEQLRAEAPGYRIHPVLLEACFLALTVTYPEKYGRRTYVPVGAERIRLWSRAGAPAWCHARLRPATGDDPEMLQGDMDLYDADGQPVLAVEGAWLKRAHRQTMLDRPDGSWRNWLYRTTWAASPPPASPPPASPLPASPLPAGQGARGQHWLVLSRGPIGTALARAARAAGATCDTADPPDAAAGPAGFGRVLSRVPGCNLVVAAWPADVEACPDAGHAAAGESVRLLHLSQELIGRGHEAPRLCLVTRGGQSVAGRPVTDPAQAALWGLGRVLAGEQPDLGFVQIDLDPEVPPGEQGALLAAELAAPDGGSESQIGYRDRRRHVARLARVPAGAAAALRPGASYLITGGLGSLGLATARLLCEQGARHLILAGRQPPEPAARAALGALERSGVRVVTMAADVADQVQVAACLDRISADPALPPLCGVFHLAGMLDDATVPQQTADRFDRVMAPKAVGAWHLHRLTRDLPLDHFVLFSSASALLGTAGQANYAAANAFLDGLAGYRHGCGLPGLAVQWGSWSGMGMSAGLPADRGGEGVIPEGDALAALAAALAMPAEAVLAVLPADWARYQEHQGRPLPLLGNVQPGGTAGSRHVTDGAFRRLLEAAPARRRRSMLAAKVREQVVQSLGTDAGLEPDSGFFSLGMDSLGSIELRNRLQADLGCRLGQTAIFDYPTLASLTDHLSEVIEGEDGHSGTDGHGGTDGHHGAAERGDGAATVDEVARRLAEKLGIGEFRDA